MPTRIFYLPYLTSRLIEGEQRKKTEKLFEVTISYIETSAPKPSLLLSNTAILKVVIQGRNYYNTKAAEDYITSVLPQEESQLFSYSSSLSAIFGSEIWRDCISRAYSVLIENTLSRNVLRVSGSTTCVENAILSMLQVAKIQDALPKVIPEVKNIESVNLESAVAKYCSFTPPPGLYSSIHPQVIKHLLKWLELAYNKPRNLSSDEAIIIGDDDIITIDDSINEDEITVLGDSINAKDKLLQETEDCTVVSESTSQAVSNEAVFDVQDKENVADIGNKDNSVCVIEASDNVNQSTNNEGEDITVLAVVSKTTTVTSSKVIATTSVETRPLFLIDSAVSALPPRKRRVEEKVGVDVSSKKIRMGETSLEDVRNQKRKLEETSFANVSSQKRKVEETLEANVSKQKRNIVNKLQISTENMPLPPNVSSKSDNQKPKKVSKIPSGPNENQKLQGNKTRYSKVTTAPCPLNDYIPLPPNAKGQLRPVVIDGSNVAIAHGVCRTFSCKGIALCIEYFLKRGHSDVIAFVPRHRLYRNSLPPVENKALLESLERKQLLVFTPSRKIGNTVISSYDDRFIIELASVNGGVIVSNDNYRDLMNESQEFRKTITERLLMYCFVGDYFMVPQDPLGRNGPKIDDFLSFPPVQ